MPGIKTHKPGEKSMSKHCGMMVLVEYRGANDVDVKFEEDGTIAKHRSYQAFRIGSIANPNAKGKWNAAKYVGMTRTATNGQIMTVTEYNGCMDITVRFEDGTVVRHIKMSAFKTGNVSNPKISLHVKKTDRIGEQRMATNGQMMEIVGYRDAHDIDVRFEDGGKAKHKTYLAFCKGGIRNPKTKKTK